MAPGHYNSEPMENAEIRAEALIAASRLREHIRETPLEYSPHLSDRTGASVFLKLECQQITGSFKLRGATNKILALEEEAGDPSKGVVTASSGNHAAAVAYSLHRLGRKGVIYLPETVATAKLEALEPYGAELRLVGRDSVVGEIEAQKAARAENLEYVSPYDDPKVIAGQGTIALELERQAETIDAVFVPVGGGGLVAGIGATLKAREPAVRVVGCQPENSRVMAESVRAGKLLELDSEPTLADGTAGGIVPGSMTFPICRRVVDEFVLVSEEEIAAAMRLSIETHCLLIEGAAALSIAALLKDPAPYRSQSVILVVSGKKVGVDTLRTVLGA